MGEFKAGDKVYAARVSRFPASKPPEVEVQEAEVVRLQRNGLRLFGAGGAFSFRTIVQPGDVSATKAQALVALESKLNHFIEEQQQELGRLQQDAALVREAFRELTTKVEE